MGVKAERSQKLITVEAFVESLPAEPMVPFGAVQNGCRCISLIRLQIDPAKILALSVRFDLVDKCASKTASAVLRCYKEFFDPETSALEFYRPPNIGEDDPDRLVGVVDTSDPAETSGRVASRGVDDAFGEVTEALTVDLDPQVFHVSFEEFGNRRCIVRPDPVDSIVSSVGFD